MVVASAQNCSGRDLAHVLVYQGVEGGAAIALTYYLTPSRTMVSRAGDLLVIDYQALQLCRYAYHTGVCNHYLLEGDSQPATTDAAVRRRMAALLGSLTILATENDGAGDKRVTALWGGATGRFRTAAPMAAEAFGGRFVPERATYTVAPLKEFPGFGPLFTSREKVFTDNPLLRRLDILGLWGALPGMVVCIESEDGGRLELVRNEILPMAELPKVPADCAHMKQDEL